MSYTSICWCLFLKFHRYFLKQFCKQLNIGLKDEQDGRLAPAYFTPNYEYFDQFLQTVKNKTTVLILVFKEFLQISSTTDFCTLCKRVSRFSIEKFSSHSAEKFRRGALLCFRKFLLSKNVRDKRGGGGEGVSRFSVENFLSHSAESFRRGTL